MAFELSSLNAMGGLQADIEHTRRAGAKTESSSVSRNFTVDPVLT
jgi:hypothetical protein